jgi:hypothetical protein
MTFRRIACACRLPKRSCQLRSRVLGSISSIGQILHILFRPSRDTNETGNSRQEKLNQFTSSSDTEVMPCSCMAYNLRRQQSRMLDFASAFVPDTSCHLNRSRKLYNCGWTFRYNYLPIRPLMLALLGHFPHSINASRNLRQSGLTGYSFHIP